MEEVLEKLENVAVNESRDESKSNFEGLYKNWGKFCNQEERRRDILDVQKQKRYDKVDKFRGILDLVKAVNETNELLQCKTKYKPGLFVAGFMRGSATYNDILMLSEWMIERPDDFNENWFVVPCPKGRRMLVVASQGTTKCYSKYGQYRFQDNTALPGGNPYETKSKDRCCVLDCFYEENSNTMYILDLLAWNNLPMTDGETDFRNYWLQIQLPDIPELKVISKKNKIKFSLLPKVLCNQDSFNEFMMKCPHFKDFYPLLDGLLFYHKKARYLPGETPLVGWLYPYMVPEILGSDITVNNAYLINKPLDYVNQADFIQRFESKIEHKINKNKIKTSKTWAMETAKAVARVNNVKYKNIASASKQTEINPCDEMEEVVVVETQNNKMESELDIDFHQQIQELT